MVNHEASFIEKDKIPLIDISGINDNIKIIEVSKLLHKASKEIGFIYVKNHGIPNNILTRELKFSSRLIIPTEKITTGMLNIMTTTLPSK